jgi:hypothetical protein
MHQEIEVAQKDLQQLHLTEVTAHVENKGQNEAILASHTKYSMP